MFMEKAVIGSFSTQNTKMMTKQEKGHEIWYMEC
jgi:hypothetical protein